MGRSTPGLGEVLAHDHHILRKIDTACTQSKTDMVVYLGGVHTLRVDTVIILLYVTNIRVPSLQHTSKQCFCYAFVCFVFFG